jgi:hypothetical protein
MLDACSLLISFDFTGFLWQLLKMGVIINIIIIPELRKLTLRKSKWFAALGLKVLNSNCGFVTHELCHLCGSLYL